MTMKLTYSRIFWLQVQTNRTNGSFVSRSF